MACVSLWHIAFLPLVLAASSLGLEKFELPHGAMAWAGTVTSALVASTVNGLYLCIIMWGSPMLLPCTSALSVPLTVALDFSLHGLQPGRLEAIGHGLVVVSVVLIMDLHSHFTGAPTTKSAIGKF